MAPPAKLTYFKARALAEPTRFLLAYGGVQWEDVVFNSEDWPTVKPTTPFGKTPTLEMDGKTLHQSVAICRHLARKFKLVGDGEWDALQADIVVDTINDARSPCQGYFRLRFFGAAADDKEALEAKKPLIDETLPYYLAKFEAIVVQNKGYFVNGKLTWADLFWAAQVDSWIGSLNVDILNNYPNLKALKERVFALPAIKAWVAKRPASINNY